MFQLYISNPKKFHLLISAPANGDTFSTMRLRPIDVVHEIGLFCIYRKKLLNFKNSVVYLVDCSGMNSSVQAIRYTTINRH